ncbi:MAG: flagellar basal-body rod protein FlgG [Legionella sp.]|nr:flagellar basal-body rod protein FlgG [Legionella sp.]
MQPALWVSKSGLEAQEKTIGTIANNLANVNTVGYKKDRALFEDLLYQNSSQAGAQSSENSMVPTGINAGTGVHLVATQKLFEQGSIQHTNNQYDVAIQGQGFFTILMPDGTQGYTRNGAFTLDSTGQVVDSHGYLLQPSITLPTGTQGITISQDGVVSATVAGSTTPTNLGTIQLTNFTNPAGLQPIGQNLFQETASSGTPTLDNPGNNGLGTLLQNNLEASNVNVVEELVNMIQAQRSYEITAKGMQTVDNMLQYLNQTV